MRLDRLGLTGFFLVFVLAFVVHGLGDGSGRRGDAGVSQRRAPPPGTAQVRRPPLSQPSELLPPISPHDPTVAIMPSRKGNSTGTAFAIGDGVWMTARHVLRGCSRFGIVTGRERVERGFDPVLSPRHDLAVFRTERSGPALDIVPAPMRRDQGGYHFGFPQGRPADVHSTLLGRMNVIPASGQRHREPVIAWAEVARIPRFSGALGGISGGPAVNDAGEVIGVTVAGSQRRGRIFTSAPAALRDMLEQAGPVTPGSQEVSGTVDAGNFSTVGRTLRRGLTIAKVICWVN